MTMRSQRLAKNLSRILAVLFVLVVAGLVFVGPAMLYAFFVPYDIPAGVHVRAGGVPVSLGQPAVAGYMLAFAVAILAAAAVILAKLRQIMRSVAAGDLFDARNADRLRVIAWTMGAMVVFEAGAGLATPVAVRTALQMRESSFDFGLFLGMLVTIVLAEVFREGTRLRADADMTV